jgi:glycosyltransferase involved in cell wall biosynthesis
MAQATDIKFSEPLVSAKMITFNHRAYIEKAIMSILSQQVDFGVELVIGEDCSTDGTREVVFDYQRRFPRHIRLVTSDSNVGMRPNGARTRKACRGKYIAFCEGDDFWHDPNKLAEQVAFLEARPEYVMVHSHCHRYYVDDNRLERNSLTVPRGLDDGKAYEDILLMRRRVMTLTVVARLENLNWVCEQCPEFKDSKWPMGDTTTWLELSRLRKVGCIHKALATKNMLPESASSSQNPQKLLRFFLAARELNLHYLKKYPVSAEVERTVREKLALGLLYHAYNAGDVEKAQEMYQDYVAQRGCASWRSRWLLWGTRSPIHQRLVSPLIKMETKWRHVMMRATAKEA